VSVCPTISYFIRTNSKSQYDFRFLFNYFLLLNQLFSNFPRF